MRSLRIILGALALLLPLLLFSSCGGEQTYTDPAFAPQSGATADKLDDNTPAQQADVGQTPQDDIQPTDTDSATQESPAESQPFFESEEHGFRILFGPGRIEENFVPAEITDFTSQESTEAVYAMHLDGNPCGAGFLIVVEHNEDELSEDGLTPEVIGTEGALSSNTVDIPNGMKGRLYSSNALGFDKDPHITVFAGQRIYYLRDLNNLCDFFQLSPTRPDEVSQRLINFAKNFEVN